MTDGTPSSSLAYAFVGLGDPTDDIEFSDDGAVSFGGITRGMRKLVVTNENGDTKEYLIAQGKHLLVQEGDFVRAGTHLSDGATSPEDILNIMGTFSVQQYIVNGIQEVYRSQGIGINDKHIEVIVRQMMRRVKIEDPGDTTFLEGEAVEKYDFLEQNDWIDLYAFTLEPQHWVDFKVANYYVSTHPDSQFTGNLIAQRPTPEARYSLHNFDLRIDRGAGSAARTLQDEAERLTILAEIFDLRFPSSTTFRV